MEIMIKDKKKVWGRIIEGNNKIIIMVMEIKRIVI
jgi:hypothetical protein